MLRAVADLASDDERRSVDRCQESEDVDDVDRRLAALRDFLRAAKDSMENI